MAEPVRQRLGFKERFAAAAGSSVAAVLVVNPLDVLKTRMQAQQSAPASASTTPCLLSRYPIRLPKNAPRLYSCDKGRLQYGQASQFRWSKSAPFLPMSSCACLSLESTEASVGGVWKAQPTSRTPSTFTVLRTLIQQEGLKTLWRGADTAVLTTVPMVGIYMPLYDHFLSITSHLGAYSPIVSGSASRVIAAFLVAPLELVRTRQQGLQSSSTNALGAIRSVFNTVQSTTSTSAPSTYGGGASSAIQARAAQLAFVPKLWTGFGATLARDIPFSALYWGMAEPIRRSMLKEFEDQQQQREQDSARLISSEAAGTSGSGDGSRRLSKLPSDKIMIANLVAGSTAGAAAAMLTTPFDVVKTRLQVTDSLHQKQSGLEIMKSILQRDGVQGLYRGGLARTARAAPACGIVIASYEVLKAHL